jgi:hypothetical protein
MNFETRLRRCLLAASTGVLLASSSPVLAQDAAADALARLEASLPGELANDPTSLDWNTQGEGLKVTGAEGDQIPGGGAAAHFNVRKAGANPWSVQAYVPITRAIPKGETVTMGFWARSATDKPGKLSIRMQENTDPYPGYGDTSYELDGEWRWYEASAKATTDISTRAGVMVFQMGAAKQEIEIGQTIVVTGADKILGHGARPPEPLPPQIDGLGQLISQPDNRQWTFFGPEAAHQTREDKTIYLGSAVHFSIPQKGENPWDVHTNVPLTEAVRTGDRLMIAVAAKTVSSTEADGKALIGVRVQQNHEPYGGFADNRFKVGPNWQLIRITTTATMDLAAGEGIVVLHMAGAAQEVDVGPAYVIKLPPEG